MATGEAALARRAVERLSLFSDAVAAIAITLLALDSNPDPVLANRLRMMLRCG